MLKRVVLLGFIGGFLAGCNPASSDGPPTSDESKTLIAEIESSSKEQSYSNEHTADESRQKYGSFSVSLLSHLDSISSDDLVEVIIGFATRPSTESSKPMHPEVERNTEAFSRGTSSIAAQIPGFTIVQVRAEPKGLAKLTKQDLNVIKYDKNIQYIRLQKEQLPEVVSPAFPPIKVSN